QELKIQRTAGELLLCGRIRAGRKRTAELYRKGLDGLALTEEFPQRTSVIRRQPHQLGGSDESLAFFHRDYRGPSGAQLICSFLLCAPPRLAGFLKTAAQCSGVDPPQDGAKGHVVMSRSRAVRALVVSQAASLAKSGANGTQAHSSQ